MDTMCVSLCSPLMLIRICTCSVGYACYVKYSLRKSINVKEVTIDHEAKWTYTEEIDKGMYMNIHFDTPDQGKPQRCVSQFHINYSRTI